MHLSRRLRAIADLIPENKVVVDIGCDHALLDIYLTQNQTNKCIACDVRPSVLEIAKKNIARAGLSQKISLVQSDGVEKVEVPEYAVAVIAGMGTSTILSILDNPKINLFSSFVIQTNNEWDILRKQMSKRGFRLVDEQIVFDKNKYYVLMKWVRGRSFYNKKQCFLGPILMNKKEAIPYYQYLQDQYQLIDSKIPKQHVIEKYQMRKKINWLKKELKK